MVDKNKPDTNRLVENMQVRRLVRTQYFDAKPQDVQKAVQQLMQGVYRWFSDLCDVAGRDPVVRRAYATRRNAISSRRVEVEASTQDEKARADVAAQAVREMLDNIDQLETLTGQMLDGLGKGIAVSEINWVYKRGYWMPEFSPVRTRDIEWDIDGGVGIRPLNGDYIRVADYPGKFWCFIPQTQTGLPTDQGDFISVLYWWLFKRWGYKFWLQGAERFGNPFVFARLPGVADVSVRNAMLQNLQDLTADSVGVFDGEATIDVIDAKMTGNANVWSEMVREFDRQIQIALVGSPDLFDAGQNGSYSAVATRNAIRLESSETEAKQLWASFQRDVVIPFLDYNSEALGGRLAAPTVKTVFESAIDVANALAGVDRGLELTKNEMRSMVGFGPMTTDDGDEYVARAVSVPEAAQGVEKPAAVVEGVPVENVQQTAFNGAQVASMLEIVRDVSAGAIERETAVEMLIAAFPIDRATAERIVGSGRVAQPVAEVDAPLPLARGTTAVSTARRSGSRTTSDFLKMLSKELDSPSATRTNSQRNRPSKGRKS
jgi:phage gp29-like protein